MPDTYRELNMKKFFLILVTVICFGKSVNAQIESVSEGSNFLLLFENTKDGVKFTSSKGCAFKTLSFTLREGETREIDQRGMRNTDDKVVKDDDLAFFRFKITKVKDGTALNVALEGIEGTTWKKLSFCIPSGSQLIDQNGML